MTPVETFATVVRTWMAERKLTPTTAGPLLGVNHVTVYAWINNQYLPPVTKAQLLAPILNVPEERLRLMLMRRI